VADHNAGPSKGWRCAPLASCGTAANAASDFAHRWSGAFRPIDETGATQVTYPLECDEPEAPATSAALKARVLTSAPRPA
jgi:hypothetical protein